jgi:hypothetical protein
MLKKIGFAMDWLKAPPRKQMTETFLIKNKRIATELTEAQSYAVNYCAGLQIVKFRYRTDRKQSNCRSPPSF